MKFAEFREKIIKAYAKHFPKGHCAVEIYKCLGKSITIDCHISPNGRCGNDMMMVCLRLELPDKFNVSENDLPESVTLEAWRNYYLTNPDNKYMAYGSNKATFRKTRGTRKGRSQVFQFCHRYRKKKRHGGYNRIYYKGKRIDRLSRF